MTCARAPHHAESLYLLGRAVQQQGRAADALGAIDRAIELRPRDAAAHDSRGQALKALGRLDAAIDAYRRAVRLEERSFAARYNLGNALFSAERFAEAALAFRRAVMLKPDFAEAHNNLGNAYRRLGKPVDAAAAFRAALRLAPTQAAFHFNLGAALLENGAPAEAEASFAAAVRIQPDHAEAWFELAALRRKQNDLLGALACHDAMLRVRPTDPVIISSRAELLAKLERWDEAEAALRLALRLLPEGAFTWANLANLLNDRGKIAESEACLDEALRRDPRYGLARYLRAIFDLTAGRFVSGWAEWEWRWHIQEVKRPFATPDWSGERAEDKVLFIHQEQGLGDYIQFCRFVPLASARARVVLQVPRTLERLIRSLAGECMTVTAEDTPQPPAFDHHISILSLARALGITIDTLPASPYLRAEPAFADAWRARIAALPGLRVGLAWAGNSGYVKILIARSRANCWDFWPGSRASPLSRCKSAAPPGRNRPMRCAPRSASMIRPPSCTILPRPLP